MIVLGRFCRGTPFFVSPDPVHNRSAFCGTAIAVPYTGFPNSIRRADHSDQSSEPKGCHSTTRPSERIGPGPCPAERIRRPIQRGGGSHGGTAIAVPYIGFPNSIRRADHSDQSRKPKGCHSTTRPSERIVSGDSPQKMTLGDSVTIVKGHFHSVLVSNIFVYLAFYWIRPVSFSQWHLQNLYLLGGFLRVCFGSYYLGSRLFTCTLVSPLCTCMIAPARPFCKTGYSTKAPKNLCEKRRFPVYTPFSR